MSDPIDYTDWPDSELQRVRFAQVAIQQVAETAYKAEVTAAQAKYQPSITAAQQVLRGVIEELQKRDDAAIAAAVADLTKYGLPVAD